MTRVESKQPQRIGVVGLGNWGTALAHHLGEQGHSVQAWSHDPDVRNELRSKRLNGKYGITTLLSSRVAIVDSLHDLVRSDYLVVAIPAKTLGSVLPQLSAPAGIEPPVLVSGVKGFDPATSKTPLGLLSDILPSYPRRVVISGPSFASDILLGVPAGIVAASDDESIACGVAELFSGRKLKVYVSTDVLGVELGGILKNVIAIGAGIAEGLGLGDSSRAALITRGLAEMTRFACALGAKQQTLFGLSGLGDLIMTASSTRSRNYVVGQRLARGEPIAAIIANLGSTAEGVFTAAKVVEIASDRGLDMPICTAVHRVITGNSTPKEALEALLARPSRREF
jgi:glycerol-3-phosphate dehydrogenase (NAD(P)+)